jgi:hypothetical protein
MQILTCARPALSLLILLLAVACGSTSAAQPDHHEGELLGANQQAQPFPGGAECGHGSPSGPDVQHSFIAFGQQTYIVGSDGKETWSYPHPTRDGYVLANGNIVLTLNKGKRYPGGAVIEVTPGGAETLIWKGTQSEVNSAHPTGAGTYVITEAGSKPRLLEVDRSGDIQVEFPLRCQTSNHHMETRMARKLPDGSYLAPHLLDFAVHHYDHSGKLLGSLDTTVAGDANRDIHSWPFTAIRHGSGNTLVTCTNGNRVIDERCLRGQPTQGPESATGMRRGANTSFVD